MIKARRLYYKLFNKASFIKEDCKNFLKSERGDTNFLSILIIFGIALILGVVFLSFKDKVVKFVDKRFKDFTKAVGK